MSLDADPAYRACVGLAVFNKDGDIFLGRRRLGPETGDIAYSWQMPQGGIDPGETPLQAAVRELYEETNIRSVSLLAEADDWLRYDLPGPLASKAWRGRYRGQAQKWFAFRFEGDDSEIDVAHPGGGMHKPEFKAWRWDRLERVPELIVPFKRTVYQKVVEVFSPFSIPAQGGSAQR